MFSGGFKRNENSPSNLVLEYSIFLIISDYTNDRMKCDICVDNATAFLLHGEHFQKPVC